MGSINMDNLQYSELEQAERAVESEIELTVAQRRRIERNREQARRLRDSRLASRHRDAAPPVDSGGGFVPEADPVAPPVAQPPSAPIVDPTERPNCLDCGCPFAQSYLFDEFGYSVCDECRDDEGAHSLLTRTEAKMAYMLKDCDLDLRAPALRCVRRRNPHGPRLGEMRLYLLPQVEERALLTWGSVEALTAERERRDAERTRILQVATRRRLRALRMAVRSSLFSRLNTLHVHEFGEEQYDAAADHYSRSCDCGLVEVYEKM